MKKMKYMLIAGLTVCGLQACKGGKSNSTTDSTSITTTDSAKTASADTSQTSADTQFADKAAAGGMAEVALGKLALQKSFSARIKNFANMMVTDHSKANDELKGIAQKENLTLPASIDAGHQAKMDSLGKLSGKDFDKAYVSAMVDGHQKTLTLMQDEANNGKNTSLKAFAAKVAPTVKMHLDAIIKIQGEMK